MRIFGKPIPSPETYEGKQEVKKFDSKHDHVFEVRGYTTEPASEGRRVYLDSSYGTSQGDGGTTYYLKGAMATTTLLKRCDVCGNFTTETIRGEWSAAQLGLDQ